MAERTKKELTLKEAAEFAFDHGIVETDGGYYELTDDDKISLQDLLRRTKWRQSTSSRNLGHSTLYAFHQALVRKLPKRKPSRTSVEWQKAEKANKFASEIDARTYQYDDPEPQLTRAIEALRVAADAWEEVGSKRRAIGLRKRADRYAETRRDRFGTPVERDKTRRMRRRRRYSSRIARDPARHFAKPTKSQAAFIHRKIPIIMREGVRGKKVNQRQATAIAYSMAGVPRRRTRKFSLRRRRR